MIKYNIVYNFLYDFDGEEFLDTNEPRSVVLESSSTIALSDAKEILVHHPLVLQAMKEDPDSEYVIGLEVERVTLVVPKSNKELSLEENSYLSNEE